MFMYTYVPFECTVVGPQTTNQAAVCSYLIVLEKLRDIHPNVFGFCYCRARAAGRRGLIESVPSKLVHSPTRRKYQPLYMPFEFTQREKDHDYSSSRICDLL